MPGLFLFNTNDTKLRGTENGRFLPDARKSGAGILAAGKPF